MGIDAIAFGLGALLLLVGLLGGGFEIREFKTPPIGRALRVIATVIGLFFIVLGIGLRESLAPATKEAAASGTTKTELTPATSQLDLNETHKAGLISAIRLADHAEVEAMRTLNASPLYGVYTGEAMRMEQNNIRTLRSNDMYQVATLENQDFQSFKVSSAGTSAEVNVVETWQTVIYRASTGQCLGLIPSHQAPQKIYLNRGDKGWIVDAIVHELGYQTPDVIPCQ